MCVALELEFISVYINIHREALCEQDKWVQNKVSQGLGMMAWWLKHLPHTHGDQSSDPENTQSARTREDSPVMPALENEDWIDP